MDHSLPGTPAADEMCLQRTKDAGSPPETGKGPTDPLPLRPPPLGWGVFHLRPYSLVEGQRGRGQTPTEQALLTPVITGHWAAIPGARVGLEVSKAAHGARSG